MILVKTSKRTEITNTREITTTLEELKIGRKSRNPEHVPPCYCQKVDQGSNSLMFQLSCSGVRSLPYGSVKYSFDITGMEAPTTATVTICTATKASYYYYYCCYCYC